MNLEYSHAVRIVPLELGHVPGILELAAKEGWFCRDDEFASYAGTWGARGLVAVRGSQVVGCVTLFKHETTAWIGNLIVHPEDRGQGLGTTLLGLALERSRLGTDVSAVLLSSAPGARAFYARNGFKSLTRIRRWCRPLSSSTRVRAERNSHSHDRRLVSRLDSAYWQDDRSALYEIISPRRSCLVEGEYEAFLMYENVGPYISVGPGIAVKPSGPVLQRLVTRLVEEADIGVPTLIDALAAGTALSKVLDSLGFNIRSSASLMYLGMKPAIQCKHIIALATLGSKG